jgi:hypothetical protein
VSAFDCLAAAPRWVAWRNERRGAAGQSGKPTKVPYSPVGGGKAKADAPATWGTRVAAEERARRLINGQGVGGIGINLGDLGADTYLGGIDLDSCIEGGICADWAQRICDLAQTYAEISPSGSGLKLFFYVAGEDVRPFLDKIGVPPDGWGCRRAAPGACGADHGPAIEVYLSHRYFAVTEKRWSGSPDSIAMFEYSSLDRIAALIPPPGSSWWHAQSRAGDNSRSAKAFGIAAKIKRDGGSFEQMLAALFLDPDTAAWVREKGEVNGGRELRRLWQRAPGPSNGTDASEGVSLTDFYAYMPKHNYIFTPTRETWPASSVNTRIPSLLTASGDEIKASTWLDQNRPVEQMTWAPGEPMIIPDRLISQGGLIDRNGVHCFNLYRPPIIVPGDPHGAQRWLDHIRLVYPDDAEHVVDFLAHRVQRPWEKINHALVLGGYQGIGKDTLIEPVKNAVGPWNFSEISPAQVMGRFNGFLRSVILRVSEARDLGEFDRFKFYDHMKAYTAAPPDVLRVDEKHLPEHSILNVCGVIITTNHKVDGI